YSRIGDFQRRLEQRGFRVGEQSRFSPELEWISSLGIAPPYREPTAAGLVIRGYGGAGLPQAAAARVFGRYEDIPPVIARSLIEMENRELAESTDSQNPVVEWDRLARASLLYAVGKLGVPVPREGGSTLATQLEKYRHSSNGRTKSFS